MTSGTQKVADRANKSIPEIVVCGVILLMVLSQFSFFWNRTVFGHDDLSQIISYYWNLETEGRWLNYLLFPTLRYFNTYVALIADFVCVGVFGYVCARNWLSPTQSFLIALLVVLAPSVVLFFDWPVIALPSMFLLAVAAMVYKKIPIWMFFLVFGLLFNATYSNVYFLLPLMFLNADSRTLLRVLFFWLAGYMIGFAVAELVTWVVCGHFIELAEFRQPNYISGWSDFEMNLMKACDFVSGHVRYMGKCCGLIVFLSIACFVWLYRNVKMRGLIIVCFLCVVATSCYAQSVPAGVSVSLRTAHCLYCSLLMFLVVSCRKSRVLLLIVALIWGGRCLYMNANNLKWQNTVRSELNIGIARLGISPFEVKGMIMLSNDNDVQEAVKTIERVAQVSSYNLKINLDSWAAAPRYAGFKSLWYRESAQEKLEELGIEERDLFFTKRGLYSFALCNGYLFVRFNHP